MLVFHQSNAKTIAMAPLVCLFMIVKKGKKNKIKIVVSEKFRKKKKKLKNIIVVPSKRVFQKKSKNKQAKLTSDATFLNKLSAMAAMQANVTILAPSKERVTFKDMVVAQ